MKKRFLLLSALVFTLTNSYAQDIGIDELGSLNVEFNPVIKTSHTQAKSVLASVKVKDGESYVLTTPTNVQQLHYLLADGYIVKKGQPFATLSGPEVHHFLSELVAARKLFEISEKRMKNSKKLFDKKLLEEDKWLTINQNYYSTSLKYEHMLHFDVLIESIDEDTDAVTIRSPISGILKKPIINMRVIEGETIAKFIPEDKIRLKLKLASDQVTNLEYVQLENCRLGVSSVSRITVDGFVDVWTESVKKECQIFLGERHSVIPHYKQQAYRVAKSAIFDLEGQDKIFIRTGNQLKIIDVSLITSIDQDYIVLSETDLTDQSVLVSSVSAVQGILIGLGGE